MDSILDRFLPLGGAKTGSTILRFVLYGTIFIGAPGYGHEEAPGGLQKSWGYSPQLQRTMVGLRSSPTAAHFSGLVLASEPAPQQTASLTPPRAAEGSLGLPSMSCSRWVQVRCLLRGRFGGLNQAGKMGCCGAASEARTRAGKMFKNGCDDGCWSLII